MGLRDDYALGLSACGYQRLPTKSRKYWLYHRDGRSYWWLGKAGAVRYSAQNRIDTSIAASEETRAKLLREAELVKSKKPLDSSVI